MLGIKCVLVRPDYYVGVTTLAELRGNCPDPKRIDESTDATRAKDPDLERAYKQRGDNQRQFNKARVDRMGNYGQYMAKVDNGGLGGYPPVTLWTKDPLDYIDGELRLLGDTVITANDGETQLAARYDLAKDDPRWLDAPFAVTITVNSNREAAMQTLHDMNHHATPVSEKETAALNVEGPLTKAITVGIAGSGIDTDLIKARTDKVTKPYITTQTILLHGGIGALYGTDALARSPNALIKVANKQFGDLGEDSGTVSAFIEDVLRLPKEILATITPDQMMALGAQFRAHKRVLAPLSKDAYSQVDTALKLERGGKRASIQLRAKAVYDRLAA